MAKNSSIEWTHHTFNPWWGCSKVSPACENCYAETWAKRVGQSLWGEKAERRFFGEKHWADPIRWNQEAGQSRSRERVFCASMADVFEKRSELDDVRTRLWKLIETTPWLDWLLLTKRPENVLKMTPWSNWPGNIWLGTTVENQKYADSRIPFLMEAPARTRFLSCEPLLGNVDLTRWVNGFGIHWVIAGGESGSNARPMNPDWVRSLRDQCQAHGIAFHFKQWGHWAPVDPSNNTRKKLQRFRSSQGEIILEAKGKKAAGRVLDGATWDQVPVSSF